MTLIRTTLTSANLNEADRQREISRIKRENSNIFNNLSVLEGELKAVFTNKTQQLRHLAENYEQLHELGEYTEPISHICATISRELINKRLGASADLARRVLDSKYKQTEFTPDNNGKLQLQSQQPTTDSNPILDTSVPTVEPNDYGATDYRLSDIINSSNAIPGLDTFVDPTSSDIIITNKSPSEMSREELRQAAEISISRYRKSREQQLEDRRRQKELLEECIKRKVALSPEFEQQPQDHKSAISEDSGPSEAYFECLALYNDWGKLCDKLYRWRPPKYLQKMMVDAFKAWREFLEPFIDEKHRKCQPSWWVVQCDNLMHGKHAAAVMNGTPISDRMQRALTTPANKRRDLTREQVGDRALEDLEKAVKFVAAIPMWKALWVWFTDPKNGPERAIAIRADELSDTLSDKAFT